MDNQILFSFIQAGTAFAAWLLAIAELCKHNKKQVNYITFFLYLIFGAGLIIDRINNSELFIYFPQFAYLNDILEMLGGVLLYFFLCSFVEQDLRIKKHELLYFVPILAVTALYLPLLSAAPQIKLANYPAAALTDFSLAPFYLFVNRYVELWVFFFIILFLFKVAALFARRRINVSTTHTKRALIMLILYALAWILLTIIFIHDNLYPQPGRQRIIMLLWSLMGCILIFLKYRYESLAAILETRAPKYHNSKMAPQRKKDILDKLQTLMQEEELYTQSVISLESVSTLLEVTPHELSETINSSLGISFRACINSHRIEKARKMLCTQQETDILTLAFECGFNSKTAFNTNFKKATGRSPRDYRQETKKAAEKNPAAR